MKQQLSRRHFLYLSAATATSSVLAACVASTPQGGQAEGGSGAAAEPINIRLAEGSWIGPEGIAFWTDTIIPAFEEANQGHL